MRYSDIHSLRKVVALDIESTGRRPWAGELPFSIALIDEEGQHRYWRWEVDPRTRAVRFPKQLKKELEEFLQSDRRILFHNGKFDMAMLWAAGVEIPRNWVQRQWFDTLIAAKILNNTLYQYGLKDLAARWASYPKDDEVDLMESTKAGRRIAKTHGYAVHEDVKADFWLADPGILRSYNLSDVERTMLLWAYLEPALEKDGLTEFFKVKMRVAEVAMRMERRGVRIDKDRLEATSQEVLRSQKEAEREMRAALPADIRSTFNPNSHQQRADLFFNRLKIRPTVWTSSGNPSSGAEALDEMEHPVAKKVRDFLTRGKLLQFFHTWADSAVMRNGGWRLHPSFNVVQAMTLRWSCDTPNLQQVPKRDEVAMRMARSIFVPDPGHVWLPADFSQMELRMLADMAGEKSMLEAFRKGADIHQQSAIQIFGEKAHLKDPKKTRDIAKSINFATVYGAGYERVSELANVELEEAARFLATYKRVFRGVDGYMSRTLDTAKRTGRVKTGFGRPMRIFGKKYYKGSNYSIQGSGVDVIDRALPYVDAMLPSGELEGLLLQVHDEVVVQVREDKDVVANASILKTLLENAGKPAFKKIRLEVDVGYAKTSWADKEEMLL